MDHQLTDTRCAQRGLHIGSDHCGRRAAGVGRRQRHLDDTVCGDLHVPQNAQIVQGEHWNLRIRYSAGDLAKYSRQMPIKEYHDLIALAYEEIVR